MAQMSPFFAYLACITIIPIIIIYLLETQGGGI